MSEFKFACPVCGQHMMCDASHGGSVMECPTCFQKIVAPQAPAPDAKFILTGSKFVEKTIPASLLNAAGRLKSPAGKSFPIGLFLLVLALLAGAGGYFFRDKISQMIAGNEWRGTDIGEVGAAGSFNRSHDVFTISGSGADTWNREDSFQFVHQPLNGGGDLSARVLSLKDTDVWAKAGVMFRETTNAGSMFALAAVRPDGQVQFVWRNGNGRIAASSQLAGGMGYPKWVRLVRKGNTFTAYYKVNATDEWQQLGTTQKMKMPKQAQAGLVVCAHHAGILSEAKLDNVILEAGNPPAAK